MTPEQIDALGPALGSFLDRFLFCCGDTRTFGHMDTYCRGLLSDLARKSVEPIALAAGVAVRTLQEFLKDHDWRQNEVREALQQHVAGQLARQPRDDLGVIGIVDETGTPKKGSKTPGVQRQWCGATGKKDNCIVTVHLGVSRGSYKSLVDADLFLPESWSGDRERCRAAGIPDDVVYRPKWRIALEQVERAAAQGIHLHWLTFDEHYGSKPEFLDDLDRRAGLYYVGEVPRSFSCVTARCYARKTVQGYSGKRADNLVRHSPVFRAQAWRRVRLARQTLAAQVWEVKAAQVYLLRNRRPTTRTYWLVVARNVATGEVKYFVSNAPARTSLAKLLRVAFQRWNVEHLFRVCKSEIGFSHYEGRHYVGLERHLILCLVTMTFVADQTERLRGEKPRDHARTSMSGAKRELLGVA
jgi:SRSO17 transposase